MSGVDVGDWRRDTQSIRFSGMSICKEEKKRMSEFNFGTPSEDARRMLPGHDGPVRNILANCQALEIEADPATTNVVWSTSVATACVIVAVHVSRLFMMENSPSELVVCVTAMTGVAWFLKDVYNCNLQWGMARLMVCLIIANCIVPRLFAHTDVVVRVKVEDDDDEMDD